MIRSLGWDPRRNEELRNVPEIKIYIWKVVFRVLESLEYFPVLTGKLLEGSGGFHLEAHLSVG